MASQLPTSTSLLTSPTNFQGIPISQLLAALYGNTTTPSSQYAQPVMHSSSASFRKGVDPRNRPDPRSAKRKAERDALNAARREQNKALNEEQARKNAEARARAKANKAAQPAKAAPANDTGNIIRTIGGTNEYGGPNIDVTTKPAADRRYDAAEAARSGARTMGAPSSVYRAPEAAPVSRTFDDPTLRPEIAAAYARVGTPEENAARRAANLAANREREAANTARREAEAAQTAALNRGVAEAQGAVSASDSRLNALRQAERDQEIETLRGLPTGMAGNLSLADVERAVLNSPQVLGRVAADGAAAVGEGLRRVEDFFNLVNMGIPEYGAPDPNIIPADRRYDAAEAARGAPRTMQPTTTEPTAYSTVRPISSIVNPRGSLEMMERFNPTLPSAGSIGADPNPVADRQYDAAESARLAPRTLKSNATTRSTVEVPNSIINPSGSMNSLVNFNPPPSSYLDPGIRSSQNRTMPSSGSIGSDPNAYRNAVQDASFMDWLRSQLPASFSDPRSMYYFPGNYY